MADKSKNYVQKLLSFMGKSILSKKDGKPSSTRISAYYLLLAIFTFSGLFIMMEGVNAIVLWNTGKPYVIPFEHITIFGMILAHHLTLLGINKRAETKVEQAVQEKLKHLNNLNPKDIPTTPPGLLTEGDAPEEDMI